MNRIMSFLERCGSESTLAALKPEALFELAVADGLSTAEAAAVAKLDRDQLAGLLSARGRMVCAVFPAKDPDQDDSDDDTDAPEERKDAIRQSAAA